jgi:3D (Asp-Asp-Asp) domain-containing protein
MGIRFFLIAFGFAFLAATPVFAAESSLLARITVYWPGEGQVRACSNGARLRAGHCAVDPKRIPYGSSVLFPDATCLAVDSGPAVVNRSAARSCGRTSAQRNALVIDRFFDSKEAALSWERSHPHFMTVRILPAGERAPTKENVAALDKTGATIGELKTISKEKMPAAPLPKFDSTKLQLGLPLNSILGPARRT